MPELPPAAAAAVARLTGRATVPHVGSAHVSAHSGAPVPTRESVGPEQSTDASASATHAPAALRRVGYALRHAKRPAVGEAKAATSRREEAPAWRSAHRAFRWTRLVIDSGCTWHVHNRLEDLHNVHDCDDVVVDANGNEVSCTKVGDLLVVARDTRNR